MGKILIATKNEGKAREYRQIFAPKGFTVVTLNDLPEKIEIEENGKTFIENATLKATALAEQTNVLTLADDSGLCVDALAGAPGIYSARYAGDHDDQANKAKLLQELKDVQGQARSAHFHCAIVVVKPDKTRLVVEGKVDGLILEEEHGTGGFGYDPLFYYPELGRSFAELSMEEKNKVSHRGRAVAMLLEKFDEWWD